MKKIITLSLTMLLTSLLLFGTEADIDVDIDVDVIVEPQQFKVDVDEIVKIIEARLEKTKLTEEQKEQIIAKIKEKIEQAEVPPIQLAVKICERTEKWVGTNDVKKCEKDIEKTTNMIKKQIDKAKLELEKEIKKHKGEITSKSVEVLESLVEEGIPVEHALAVVKEAMKGKEGDVDVVARQKILSDIKEGKIELPVELKEEIMGQIQLRIQTQAQIQEQLLEQKQIQNQQQLEYYYQQYQQDKQQYQQDYQQYQQGDMLRQKE